MARLLLLWLVAADVLAAVATARMLNEVVGSKKSNGIAVALPPSSDVHLRVLDSAGHAGAPSNAPPHKRHQQLHKSVIGGEVILGVLGVAAIVAVFCYVRITRRRAAEDKR